MRTVAREHGATYAINEVVLDALVLQKGKLQRRILSVPEHDHPVGGQLMGSQPETFGQAARELVRAGYDIVDINFGCPVNKVLGRHRGGWLLQDSETALSIVASVLQAVQGDAPVTVKMRRGTDDSPEAEARFWTILDGAMSLGVAAATVHPRTVKQKYVGPSRWEFLAKVKQHVGDFTLLGSGDLFSAYDVVDMLQQTGVDAVKLEGGLGIARSVANLVAAGIPVLGHIGLLPQRINDLGSYRRFGKNLDEKERLLADARALEEAGAFAIVGEMIEAETAGTIRDALSIPLIGIGSGDRCDGQIRVVTDLLGLGSGPVPSFVKVYADLGKATREAPTAYATDVRSVFGVDPR